MFSYPHPISLPPPIFLFSLLPPLPTLLPLLSTTGILVVVSSSLVLIFNIGVPNDLKGFLFFAQVVGFVYQHGADEGPLLWVRETDGTGGDTM